MLHGLYREKDKKSTSFKADLRQNRCDFQFPASIGVSTYTAPDVINSCFKQGGSSKDYSIKWKATRKIRHEMHLYHQ